MKPFRLLLYSKSTHLSPNSFKFLTGNVSRNRDELQLVRLPHYMFCPRKKIISRTFKINGTLIVMTTGFPLPLVKYLAISTSLFKPSYQCAEAILKQHGSCYFLKPPWKTVFVALIRLQKCKVNTTTCTRGLVKICENSKLI